MRWKRGSRAFLRLPCVWLLLLLPLAAAAGLGEEFAAPQHGYGGSPYPPASSANRGDIGGTPAPVKETPRKIEAGAAERSAAEESERNARSGRRLDEDEASRILWRGWLLVDEAPSRRKAHITPKSVFIAPVIRGEGSRGGGIPACAEGYRSDAMGRCHKVVRVNQAAHLDFLLQRLNALYGEPSQAASSASQADASDKGPLLVTIPLATNLPQDKETDGEDDSEGNDEVDLVVVAEASIKRGPFKDMPDRFDVFRGEQMAAESQEEMVVEGMVGPSADETTDRMMADKLVDHPYVMGKIDGINTTQTEEESDEVATKTRETGMTHPAMHSEYHNETVTASAGSNSTEQSNGHTVTETTVLSTGEDSDENATPTTASNVEDSNVDGMAEEGHFSGGQFYETTFIADYSTTDQNSEKVTESPEVSHKISQGLLQDGNFTNHKSDEMNGEPQKRIVFPGQVTDSRVRFPESDTQQLYPNLPTPSTPSEIHSIAPSQPPPKGSGHLRGGWNRPLLLKFWTQMPLIREPSLGSESTIKRASPTTNERDTNVHIKQGDGWSFPGNSDAESKAHYVGPNQRRPWIYYQEMSPRELASVSRVFDRVRHFETRG